MKRFLLYGEFLNEEANMLFDDKLKVSSDKNEFPSAHAIGDIIAFIPNKDSRVIGIVKEVSFTPLKVKYTIQTLEGGMFDNVYSTRIVKATKQELDNIDIKIVNDLRKQILDEYDPNTLTESSKEAQDVYQKSLNDEYWKEAHDKFPEANNHETQTDAAVEYIYKGMKKKYPDHDWDKIKDDIKSGIHGGLT